MTHTITTDQIQSRLSQSFENVKGLKNIDTEVIEKSNARTVSMFNYMNFTFIVGVYEYNDNDFERFVFISPIKKAFIF